MEVKCGVCQENESKYKCPHCLLRYCSVKCFKTHIPTHNDEPTKPKVPSITEVAPLTDPAPPPANPFAAILADPRLQILYSEYPLLKAQLKQVFKLSLPPSEPLDVDKDEGQSNDGGNGPNHFQRKKTQMAIRGKWSQEKGDKAALRRLVEIAERDEGMREFVELCAVVIGDRNVYGDA